MVLLAGDVGGTKTSLAVYCPGTGPMAPLEQASFPSAQYPGLAALVEDFLSGCEWSVDQAVFAVAGPVLDGKATITNLRWLLDESRLRARLGLSEVRLVNDLMAMATSIPFLQPGDLQMLREGKPSPGGTIALIAPGTGLGEAFLTWDGTRYHAHASEGGHVDFAPGSHVEIGLLRHLMRKLDHVSYERVCSGSGLPSIYAYLKESGYAPEPGWLAERFSTVDDATPLIVTSALDSQLDCALCQATLKIFVSILGAEAGNLALKVLATGGVYLGGGIPPRILSVLESGAFLEAFQRKGRLSELLRHVPIYVIVNDRAALLGAACIGLHVAEAAPSG